MLVRRGGRGGGGVGFTGVGGSRHQKADSFGCRIKSDAGAQFDETELVNSLKEDVEREIRASGAQILDGGDMGGGFYFGYGLGDIQGRIDVSGKRARGDYYELEATLEEKREK